MSIHCSTGGARINIYEVLEEAGKWHRLICVGHFKCCGAAVELLMAAVCEPPPVSGFPLMYLMILDFTGDPPPLTPTAPCLVSPHLQKHLYNTVWCKITRSLPPPKPGS